MNIHHWICVNVVGNVYLSVVQWYYYGTTDWWMAMGMNTYLLGCYYYVLTYFLGCGYDIIICIPNDSNNILYSNDIVNDSGVPSVCKTCTNSMTLTHFIPGRFWKNVERCNVIRIDVVIERTNGFSFWLSIGNLRELRYHAVYLIIENGHRIVEFWSSEVSEIISCTICTVSFYTGYFCCSLRYCFSHGYNEQLILL
jgi:hypothetical protein